jgi:hypothetical protein
MTDDLPPDHGEPPTGAQGSTPRRGRPPGSISLTPEIQLTIVAYIRAGAFAHVAAQAAGVPPRTFFDWMARGESRHPTRRPTRKLRAFAQAVRRAQAEARIGAEVRVYKENPARWLSYAARSTSDQDGWSEPPSSQERSDSGGTLERWIAELDREQERTGRCWNSLCPCHDQERSDWDGRHQDGA